MLNTCSSVIAIFPYDILTGLSHFMGVSNPFEKKIRKAVQ